MPEDHVMVKLDFSNAFNCLHRRGMLLALQQYSPDIYSYCYSAYSRPTHLSHGILRRPTAGMPVTKEPNGLLIC